jgi:hypothetical protein
MKFVIGICDFLSYPFIFCLLDPNVVFSALLSHNERG